MPPFSHPTTTFVTPRPCRWTIVAGDSNNRAVFRDWLDVERSRNRTLLRNERTGLPLPPRPGGLGGTEIWEADWLVEDWVDLTEDLTFECYVRHGSDENTLEDYGDHEILITDPDNDPAFCHILTQKFHLHQEYLDRWYANVSNFDYCGTALDPIGDDQLRQADPTFVRPSQPDLIWLSHGLWKLPNGWGQSADDLTCDGRFESVVTAVRYWHEHWPTTRVIWQTLFPVLHHPVITNEYLAWDVRCQRETAQTQLADAGVTVFDLYKRVAKSPEKFLYEDDYHLNELGKTNLIDDILSKGRYGGQKGYFGECCFLWSNNWNV